MIWQINPLDKKEGNKGNKIINFVFHIFLMLIQNTLLSVFKVSFEIMSFLSFLFLFFFFLISNQKIDSNLKVPNKKGATKVQRQHTMITKQPRKEEKDK